MLASARSISSLDRQHPDALHPARSEPGRGRGVGRDVVLHAELLQRPVDGVDRLGHGVAAVGRRRTASMASSSDSSGSRRQRRAPRGWRGAAPPGWRRGRPRPRGRPGVAPRRTSPAPATSAVDQRRRPTSWRVRRRARRSAAVVRRSSSWRTRCSSARSGEAGVEELVLGRSQPHRRRRGPRRDRRRAGRRAGGSPVSRRRPSTRSSRRRGGGACAGRRGRRRSSSRSVVHSVSSASWEISTVGPRVTGSRSKLSSRCRPNVSSTRCDPAAARPAPPPRRPGRAGGSRRRCRRRRG